MDRLATILRLRRQGLTESAIAEHLGITASALAHWLRRNGHLRANGKVGRPVSLATATATQRYAAAYLDGVPVTTIARRARKTRQSIRWHLHRAGIQFGGSGRRPYTTAEDQEIMAAVDRLAKQLHRPRTQIASRINTLLYPRR